MRKYRKRAKYAFWRSTLPPSLSRTNDNSNGMRRKGFSTRLLRVCGFSRLSTHLRKMLCKPKFKRHLVLAATRRINATIFTIREAQSKNHMNDGVTSQRCCCPFLYTPFALSLVQFPFLRYLMWTFLVFD